ncbi:hypothetical protein ZHAS_00021737 [Anopheles sinensis]|uniref:Uncharacterized protein n=1 Tax=Anopheles sinensis TaxID=74873 RepID=A0A084WTG6_ANOSI|nr:hypothetical protein ZHAS_00021737 [Anopheles sinensis]
MSVSEELKIPTATGNLFSAAPGSNSSSGPVLGRQKLVPITCLTGTYVTRRLELYGCTVNGSVAEISSIHCSHLVLRIPE